MRAGYRTTKWPPGVPPARDCVRRTVLRMYTIRYAVRMSRPTPQDKDTELRPLIDLLPRRRKRRSGADQATLSREQVVRVAIELADADGSEAISMRRIASQLDVGTMTLYGYVEDRDALLAYMLDQALGDVELPARPSGDWRADLELLSRQFRTVCLRHSWLPALLGTTPYLLAPRVLPAIEFCLSALVPFGMNVQRAGEVLRLLNNYVVGMTLREAAESRTAGRHRDTGYDAAVAGYLHQIILSGRYPAFSQLATIILEGRDLDPDQSFDLGLQCLLDVVVAQLAKAPVDS